MKKLITLFFLVLSTVALSQVQVDFSGVAESRASAVFADDHFWIIGDLADKDSSYLALASFNSDGTIQSSFGKSGQVRIAIDKGRSGYEPNAACVDNKGRVLVAGRITRENRWNWFVIRLLSNGSIDKSFGVNGFFESDVSKEPLNTGNVNRGSEEATAIKVLKNNQILVVGTINEQISTGGAIARLNDNGILDTGFGENGIVRPFQLNRTVPTDILLQEDNSFFVGGDSWYPESKTNSMKLAYFDINGKNIESFNEYGSITTSVICTTKSCRANLNKVIMLDDGSFIFAGSHFLKNSTFAVVGHFLKDGSRDELFAGVKKPTGDEAAFRYYFKIDKYTREFLDVVQTNDGGLLLVLDTYSDQTSLVKTDKFGVLSTIYGPNAMKNIDLNSNGSDDRKFLIKLNNGTCFFCSTSDFKFYLERID